MLPTKNIVQLADITKIKVIAENNDASDLEDWSLEMPNAPYSNCKSSAQSLPVKYNFNMWI